MKFSDIQLADNSLWVRIQQAWKNGDYGTAISIAENEQLAYKGLTAQTLNALTSKIVEVEELNDPLFLKDRIKVTPQVPTDLDEGQVYFDWTNSPPYSFGDIDKLNYTFGEVNRLGLTWYYIDRGWW